MSVKHYQPDDLSAQSVYVYVCVCASAAMKVQVKCFLINSLKKLFVVKDDGFVHGHDENAGFFNICFQAFITASSATKGDRNDDWQTGLTQTYKSTPILDAILIRYET